MRVVIAIGTSFSRKAGTLFMIALPPAWHRRRLIGTMRLETNQRPVAKFLNIVRGCERNARPWRALRCRARDFSGVAVPADAATHAGTSARTSHHAHRPIAKAAASGRGPLLTEAGARRYRRVSARTARAG
jgi:hypothetical protein